MIYAVHWDEVNVDLVTDDWGVVHNSPYAILKTGTVLLCMGWPKFNYYCLRWILSIFFVWVLW